MLIEARELQDRAVRQLLQVVKDRTAQGIKEITFKAPTGSGKTFMMADFCNRILNEQDDVIFLISSLLSSLYQYKPFDSNSIVIINKSGLICKLIICSSLSPSNV